MIIKRCLLALAASAWIGWLGSRPAAAAPPGWELRNGSWVPIVQPGSGSPEEQVAKMIQDLRDGLSANVIKDAKDWIKRNPRHPLMPQVLLLQGDAENLRGNKYSALYPYEDLLNNYPFSELYLPTLEREYYIADAFLKGYKRKFLGLRILPVNEDALQVLDRIQDRQRGSAIAERAGLRIADYYFDSGKFPEAIDSYTFFLDHYGKHSQYVRKAEVRRVEAQIGNFRGILFDFLPLVNARVDLQTVAEAYPQTAEDMQIRAIDDHIYQLEGQQELEIARYYFRAGKKYASAYYYKRVIKNWPDTSFAQTARKELAAKLPTEAAR